ncbi:hypothetical protein BN970_01559 [Mycolicibacterium conceptionense]|uniref:Uncharacterized protein n=1 Tax=Mycolicibacterium conceptionense TaxID=451644 RepID=A0A0U1D6Z8_9MYCO|nr:hypothetical protein BN970_01559 [Mycolicibacterium conceptionense]
MDVSDRSLTGRIGWSRTGEQITNVWNDTDKAWVDTVVSNETSAASPFWFAADRRYLGYLDILHFDPKL